MLIPRFDVSQMVKRGKRKIRSKTARAMLDMGTLPLSTAFAVCLKVVSTHGAVSLWQRSHTLPKHVAVVDSFIRN